MKSWQDYHADQSLKAKAIELEARREWQAKGISYQHLIRQIQEVVRTTIPSEATVIVASTDEVLSLQLGGAQAWPFTQTRDATPARLFATGSAGSVEVPWIKMGAAYDFHLYAGMERKQLLATVKVTRGGDALLATSPDHQGRSEEAVLTATPNPVAAGDGLGTTTIRWQTGDGQEGEVYVTERRANSDTPVDSITAINRLEALRAKGGEFLLFPSTAFWWLEYYAEFRQHLDTYHRCIWSDEYCLIYQLSRSEPTEPSLVKALVAGWFSFEHGHATAGDLLARDLVCEWLESTGYSYDVASVSPFRGEVNWRAVDPNGYSDVVFVCGPFGNGAMEAEFLSHFADCRLIGLNLSMLDPVEVWNPFDLLLERDSSANARPDMIFGSRRTRVPVVGVCLVEPYEGAMDEVANDAISRLVASREMAVVHIDTRLDINSTGLRRPAEVESLLARMDLVVTTRLHGMVLALKNGVPAIAIDPEAGGFKIQRQAQTIGWPIVFNVDALSDEALQNAVDYCLTDDGRAKARQCGNQAGKMVEGVRDEFISTLARSRSWRKSIDAHLGRQVRVSDGKPENIALQQDHENQPAIGEVRFGSLRRVTPISQEWGSDRGQPIDRYYIENFLARQAEDIQGRVLEIGDNSYTKAFGGSRVTTSDVLHVTEGNPQATFVGDLTSAAHIPSDTFDCVVLTQTLHLIYDVQAAVRTIHRILKPGGILLATFPGITQIGQDEWRDTWYWSFTTFSARRLFEEVFSAADVQVEAYGNVLAAISFLEGLAVRELRQEELDHRDPSYEVTITVRASKPKVPLSNQEDETPSPRVRRRQKGQSAARGAILLYHRVAEGGNDPWGLCVTPAHFSEQLEVLQQRFCPMPLHYLRQALEERHLPRPPTMITFDDGYADNLYHAKPLLERYDIPATIFVATGYVGGEREFWWDELERLLLEPGTLPRALRLGIKGNTFEWNLGEAACYSDDAYQLHRGWTAYDKDDPTPRHSLYRSLHQLLHPMLDEERRMVLDELVGWANTEPIVRPSYRALTREELSTLDQGGLIEVGAHTVSHPALASLPVAEQRLEIRQSKADLEEALGHRVTSFAYPYGSSSQYTAETVALVREAGFMYACSTSADVVRRGVDPFQLPRIYVHDWDGPEFDQRLSKWFYD